MKFDPHAKRLYGGAFKVDKKTPPSGVDHHATLGIAQLILRNR
jgi:hypothetical protein